MPTSSNRRVQHLSRLAALLIGVAASVAVGQNCSPNPIAQLGGGTVAVARVGGAGSTTVVAGAGSRFEVLNVGVNPPTLAGSIDLGKRIVNIDTTGNYSYVLLPDQLVVIDHSVPGVPVPLTQAPVPPDATQNGHPNNLAQSVDVSGTRAVIARGEDLHIYDTSLPQSPVLTATYSPGLYGDISDAVVSSSFAYVASYNQTADVGFIAVIDIANAGNPFFRGAVNLLGTSNRVTALAISGNTLFAASIEGGGTGTRMRRVDVTNPTAPALLPGSVVIPGIVTRLAVDGSVVYAAGTSGGASVVNYASPAAPVFAALIATSGSALDVSVNTSTRRLFIADTEGGFRVFNVTNPLAPLGAGSRVAGPGNARDMVINDAATVAFIADGGAGLRTVSITNPASPALLARLPLAGSVWSIARTGNIAVLGGSSSLHIVDVAAPAAPVLRSTVSPGDAVVAVAAQGNLAYCTVGSNELRIYDIANPAAPVLRGSGPLFAGRAVIGMTVSGTRLVVLQHNTIELWDVANPAAPVMRSSINQYSSEAAISGNTLYSAGLSGLQIFDISDLSQPIATHTSTTGGGLRSLSLSGPNATAVDFEGRLRYYSIANLIPVLLSTSQPLGIDAQRIHLRGITLHLADGIGGYRSLERFTWYPPKFDPLFDPPASSQHTLIGPTCATTFSAPPVISNPSPTYRWFLRNVLLSDGPAAFGTTVSGATTASITISGLRGQALGTLTGQLTCQAENTCGVSSAATVAYLRPCVAEFNCDQTVNPDDLGDFINCYFATSPPCADADFNADGNTDPDDLGDYINAYFGGACG